jgi:hypothetical protein
MSVEHKEPQHHARDAEDQHSPRPPEADQGRERASDDENRGHLFFRSMIHAWQVGLAISHAILNRAALSSLVA